MIQIFDLPIESVLSMLSISDTLQFEQVNKECNHICIQDGPWIQMIEEVLPFLSMYKPPKLSWKSYLIYAIQSYKGIELMKGSKLEKMIRFGLYDNHITFIYSPDLYNGAWVDHPIYIPKEKDMDGAFNKALNIRSVCWLDLGMTLNPLPPPGAYKIFFRIKPFSVRGRDHLRNIPVLLDHDGVQTYYRPLMTDNTDWKWIEDRVIEAYVCSLVITSSSTIRIGLKETVIDWKGGFSLLDVVLKRCKKVKISIHRDNPPPLPILLTFSFLTPHDLVSLLQTCKSYYVTIQDDIVWYDLMPRAIFNFLNDLSPSPLLIRDLLMTASSCPKDGIEFSTLALKNLGSSLGIRLSCDKINGIGLHYSSRLAQGAWIGSIHFPLEYDSDSLFEWGLHMKDIWWVDFSISLPITPPPGKYAISWKMKFNVYGETVLSSLPIQIQLNGNNVYEGKALSQKQDLKWMNTKDLYEVYYCMIEIQSFHDQISLHLQHTETTYKHDVRFLDIVLRPFQIY